MTKKYISLSKEVNLTVSIYEMQRYCCVIEYLVDGQIDGPRRQALQVDAVEELVPVHYKWLVAETQRSITNKKSCAWNVYKIVYCLLA